MGRIFLLLLFWIIISLAIYNLFRVVDVINKLDDEKIADSKRKRLAVSVFASIVCLMVFAKFGLSLNTAKYFLLIIFVVITGYIDYHNENVYEFISKIFALIGIIFFLVNFNIYHATSLIKFLVINFLICFIGVKFKGIGLGDLEVFLIITLFIPGFASTFNIFFSFAISGIGALYHVLIKRKSIYDARALCPYIAVSTIILLLVL